LKANMAGWGKIRAAIPKKERPVSSIFDVVMLTQAAAKSGILAHDVNKGAPCFECGDKCPGFELHFWRKHCTNCKCGPAAHEVKDDVFFGIFSPATSGAVGRRPMISLTANDNTTDASEGNERSQYSPDKIRHTTMGSKIGNQKRIKKRKVGPPTKPKPQVGKEAVAIEANPIYDTASPGGPVEWEEETEAISFVWEPAGLNPQQVLEYFESYPDEQVPVVGFSGERKFRKDLDQQMPKHDFDVEACHALTADEKEEFATLIDMKQTAHHLGVAVTISEAVECAGCREVIPTDNVAVELVVKGGRHYHPHCLTCSTCSAICIGMNAFLHEGQVYCGRHYNDIFKARCAACDESIMEDSYVKAEGQCWHKKHFCCTTCDVHLAGQRYVPIDSKPHCVECYYKINPKAKSAVRLNPAQTPEEPPQAEPERRAGSIVSKPDGDKPGGQIYILASSRPVPREIKEARPAGESRSGAGDGLAVGGPVMVDQDTPAPKQVVRSSVRRSKPASTASLPTEPAPTRGEASGVPSHYASAGRVTVAPKSASGGGTAPLRRGESHHGETKHSRTVRSGASSGGSSESAHLRGHGGDNKAKRRPVSMKDHGTKQPGSARSMPPPSDGKKRPVAMSSHTARAPVSMGAHSGQAPASMRTHGGSVPSNSDTGKKGKVDMTKVHVVPHIAEPEEYEVLWPEDKEARIRLATAVPSQFAKSTRRGKASKGPVGFSSLSEEPEHLDSATDDAPPIPSRATKPV
jgi:hypothetical protein